MRFILQKALLPRIDIYLQASVDVGGKLLTNHLKELVSYRQWNMMDETFIVNDVKEKCCFLSQDFKRDLEICARLL